MSRRFFTFIVLAGHAVPLIASVPVLPTSPINPTMEDCRILASRYYSILSDLNRENLQCLEGGPDFGWAPGCSGSMRYTAYRQCSSIVIRICQVEDAKRTAVSDCRTKVRSRADQERNKKAQDLKKANDAYDNARRGIDFISSPKEFLASALNPFPSAKDQVFDVRKGGFNDKLAEQLYRYMENQTKAGLSATRSPTVRAFQSEALDHVLNSFGQTLHQLEGLSADIQRFDSSFKTWGSAKPISTSIRQAGLPVPPTLTGDCKFSWDNYQAYLTWCPGNDNARNAPLWKPS